MNHRTRLLPTSVWWQVAYWILFAVWISDAVAVMMHLRAGFLTSHGADLTMPSWLYIVFRRHDGGSGETPIIRTACASPMIVGAVVLFASCATEVSQYFWPHGLFAGTFDWYDLLTYLIGMSAVVAADLRWPIRAPRS